MKRKTVDCPHCGHRFDRRGARLHIPCCARKQGKNASLVFKYETAAAAQYEKLLADLTQYFQELVADKQRLEDSAAKIADLAKFS